MIVRKYVQKEIRMCFDVLAPRRGNHDAIAREIAGLPWANEIYEITPIGFPAVTEPGFAVSLDHRARKAGAGCDIAVAYATRHQADCQLSWRAESGGALHVPNAISERKIGNSFFLTKTVGDDSVVDINRVAQAVSAQLGGATVFIVRYGGDELFGPPLKTQVSKRIGGRDTIVEVPFRYLRFRTFCNNLREGQRQLRALQSIAGISEVRGLIVR